MQIESRNSVIEDFHYILSRIFDSISYPQAVVLYNQYIGIGKYSINNDKIKQIANLLRQKENVVNE